MSDQTNKKLPGISRRAEEANLLKTLTVIQDNVENTAVK